MKRAVVTGAAGGIGRELALELARRRSRVVLADIDPEGCARTAGGARTDTGTGRSPVPGEADRSSARSGLSHGMPWPGTAAAGQTTLWDVFEVAGDVESSIDVPLR